MATRARVVAPFALAALSAAAGLSLGRVFDSDGFVLAVLGAALVPHAIGALTRARRWPAWIGVGLVVVALAAYVVWALVPGTTTFGLPTSSTFDTLERQLRGGWHVLRTAPAPAPVTDGTLLLAVIATWAVATVADWLAFRRNATLAAVAPALVLFVWSSTLGTSDHQTLTVSAFAVAAGAFLMVQNIAVLDRRRSWLMSNRPARGHWLAPAVVLGLVALLVGLVLAPALPGAESDPILEFANSGPNRDGGRSYSTRVPPLVDVGAKLQTEDNYEVFTVRASQPEYWRLTALDDFTTEGGGQWTLSAEGGAEVDDDLPEHLTEGTLHQEYDIGRLGERWLPAAFRPVAASTPALVVRSSGTLVSDEDTVQGLQYTADSRLAPLRAAITPEQQAATAQRVPARLRKFTTLPVGMPTVIAGTAQQVVADAGAATPYAHAAALRDYFWANYVYDLDVDPRDDTNAIASFISEKRGFCVQFASTYAVMARSLGIPSRVAVGFTPGDPRDGVFHVQSHNAHAWPEIWLAGLGWTHLFDPTPPAGSSGVTAGGSSLPGDQTVAPPPTPGVVTTVPPPPTSTPTEGTSTPTTAITSAPVPPLVTTTAPGGDSQPWIVVMAILAAIVAAVLIYVAVVVNAKSRRRTRRRDAAEPAVAVQGAWDEALDKLREANVPSDPALTPLELARSAPRRGVTAATRPLRNLARSYTVVRYGVGSASSADAERAWAAVDELDRALDEGLTRRERWRRRIDPSTLRPGSRH
jgi:hypothetical protein